MITGGQEILVHIIICKSFEYLRARTVTDRNKVLHESGIRFSELLNIPHFDIVCCHVIDPMHNIFLGLAKHMIHTWKDKDKLRHQQFSQLQEKVDSLTPPPKIGRIPRKIESGFASFTADEWKNWLLIYSSYTLHDIIDDPHYKCWSLLVDTCLLLCQPVISPGQIHQAHVLLVEFCKLFETLYGAECCTPNMHMSLHLKECLLDYGPFPAFWCFAFERYNGILLEGISKSWILPEKQMFLKFSEAQKLKSLGDSLRVSDDFLSLVADHMAVKAKEDDGSLGETKTKDSLMIQDFKNISCAASLIDGRKKSHQCLISPFKEK